MNRFPNANSPLFLYLLRELSSEEERKIEDRLLNDPEYREELSIAEYELVEAYIFEGLTEFKRDRFERYFLCTEERKQKLRLAQAMHHHIEKAYASERAKVSRFHRLRRWMPDRISLPVWPTVAASLVMIGLGLLGWMCFSSRITISRGIKALKSAYAQERPLEARIAGFDYAHYPMSQSDSAAKVDPKKRDKAFSLIIGLEEERNNPAAYHAIGKFYLTERRFNDAVECFELALKNDDRNAKLLNDLAVALMSKEKAKTPEESTGEDFAGALEYLHRAIELDGSLLEAYFNLALCHQYQMLWRTAEEDWKKYLEKDPQSPWAEEARKNLRMVTERINKVGETQDQIQNGFIVAAQQKDAEQAWQAFKGSRLHTGSFITNKVIDDYLSSALSGRAAEADQSLQALLFLGEIELEKVGDRFTFDLAQFYRGASLQQLQKLMEARGALKSAYDFYGQSLLDKAIDKYQQARKLFGQAGDIGEALAAQYWLGHCYFRLANTRLSLRALTPGSQECENRAYLWLLGMYQNDLANVALDLTRYSEALDHARNVIASARRIEDENGIRRGLNRTSDIYMLLASYRDSLPVIQEGLSLATRMYAAPSQIVGFYALASKSYLGLDRVAAALDYQREALKLSLEMNNPVLTSRHYIHLGLVYDKLNEPQEAIKLIQSGLKIGQQLPDGDTSREIVAYSHLYLGQIYRELGDFDSAVKSYAESLRLYSGNDHDSPLMVFRGKKGLLLSHIEQGDDAAVEKELTQLIELYEQHRQNIEEENSRNSFFDDEQGTYDIAVKFAYFKQRKERTAFDYSEMNRARSLLDTVDLTAAKLLEGDRPGIRLPRSTQPLGLDQLQGRLPDKLHLLQYALLDDKLIIWVVSRNDLKSRAVDIDQTELSSKVTAYVELLASNRNDSKRIDYRALSSELYGHLIKPVEDLLVGDAEICIVPDKALNRLPFSSLISPSTGKYLIEERAILMSPSANMFIVATEKARQKEDVKSERLLSIGNPSFDKSLFRTLKDLPWAADQASKIASFYPTPTVLLGQEARETAIRKGLEKSDVVHFAMHYVVNESTPMLSLLPLAEEKASAPKDRDGVLRTYEFYKMNLSRLRLVILSACQTGIEGYHRGEGAIGLARAFEAAGIPMVVASLWPVDSYPTKELMVSFHQHRKRDGLPTAQALRRAQLDMINSADPELHNPYHWAVYSVIGGHAGF